ncbi:unnamed protein product [Psylliodes chrysocephalus]|uniref:Uncharacterized protein n=1 Tax=Psylliodes chrysocephalus TaxID=3402493 RepID=A0A9P0CNT7_9CUCU|nr:unnamed protein product [Psylliodes chrysocephala]
MFLTIVYSIIVFIFVICISLRIYSRYILFRCKSNICLEGKTAIVTGGSLGIGYHIVCNLASRGCKIIVADKVITDDVKDAIYKETNSKKITYEYVDLASFKSVREFAERINSTEEKLDILIHNAGIGKSFGTLSEDGLNVPMQINYYSAFLMTHLLIDIMKKSPAARLIFAGSAFSFFNTISINKNNPDDINLGTMQLDYHTSKFCVIAASDIFSAKLKEYNIMSNSYHPGVVRTRMINQFKGEGMTLFEAFIGRFLSFISFLIGKSPEEGAQIALHLACSREMEGVTGNFFGEGNSRFKPIQAYNKKLCQLLWSHSEKIVKLTPEEILS